MKVGSVVEGVLNESVAFRFYDAVNEEQTFLRL